MEAWGMQFVVIYKGLVFDAVMEDLCLPVTQQSLCLCCGAGGFWGFHKQVQYQLDKNGSLTTTYYIYYLPNYSSSLSFLTIPSRSHTSTPPVLLHL